MSKPQSRLGDTCVHTNKIVSGSPDTIVGGKLAARKGDVVSPCPVCKAPPGKIASGSSSVFINSKAAARITDKVACGSAGVPPGGGTRSGVTTYQVKPEDNYVEAVFRDDSFLLQEEPGGPQNPPEPDRQPPRPPARFLEGLSLDLDLGKRAAGSGVGGGINAVLLGDTSVIVGG
jgi:uncharacterized Zn-binding protein involved in type VI secretion